MVKLCSLDTRITSFGPGVLCRERKGVCLLAGNHGLGDKAGFAFSCQLAECIPEMASPCAQSKMNTQNERSLYM
jgi:hypothetical protein